MAVFPPTLPAPLIAGHEINPIDPILRTQMDAGVGRTRRQFTAVPDKTLLSWIFTEAELALFEAWHKFTALDGTAWFNINLPDGMGIVSREAQFSKPVKKIPLGGRNWQVSGEVQVRNRTTLSALEMELALIYPPNDLSRASLLLHTLITTLPSPNYW